MSQIADADIEKLRRAMVDAHDTLRALSTAMEADHTWVGVHDAMDRARCDLVEAAKRYESAVYLSKLLPHGRTP